MKSEAELIDDVRINTLFKYRCVGCMSPATEVHELIPRSRTKHATTMKQNRVPICRSCHHRAHFEGYNYSKESFLRNKAIERLIMFGISLEEW